MRAPAGLLLAVLLAGAAPSGGDPVVVTLAAQPVPGSCAVLSTATIVGYDLPPSHRLRYRFVRSDGTVSRTRTLALGGSGAVARSVQDRWTPRGAVPWVTLEVAGAPPIRSDRLHVAAHCTPKSLAQR